MKHQITALLVCGQHVELAQGKKVPAFVDTGVVIVTKANVDLPEARNFLY